MPELMVRKDPAIGLVFEKIRVVNPLLARVSESVKAALKDYVQVKGIVDRQLLPPKVQSAEVSQVAGEIYNYITDGNNLNDLLLLENIRVIDNLVDTVLGKKDPAPTDSGKVAAWILVADYSVFQATVTPGSFSSAYPNKDAFVVQVKAAYDEILNLYRAGDENSPGYNPVVYTTFPDLMDGYLDGNDYAKRVGALIFLLLHPVKDGVLPTPYAGYIAEGFNYVRKTDLPTVSSNADPSILPGAVIKKPTPSQKKSNLPMYIGIGVASVILVGGTVYLIRQK